jgi:uncharacterized protein (DUF1501 family)
MIDPGHNESTPRRDISRRDFLRATGVGLAASGLTIPALDAREAAPSASDRSVILLLLVGGPSQLETFDPKPDAPAEIRGPFRSIATRIPGVRVSEHLPGLATRMDRVALVRSVHHDAAPIHETGYQLLQTGRQCQSGEEFPHFGSVVDRISQPAQAWPQSVILPGPIGSTGVDIPHGQSAGCLGSSLDPAFHSTIRLSAKWDRALEAYGRTPFGQNCLLAHRLVENGVRVVTVNMYETVFGRVTWDCHGSSPFSTFDDYVREVLPTFDRAFGALLDDLERSGRLDSTLVVAAGEFGRSPRLNATGGRDHWPGVWTVALAGGGVRAGQVVGASDATAAAPADRPVTLPDLLATMYFCLGLDPQGYVVTAENRSIPLVENGQPVSELFS